MIVKRPNHQHSEVDTCMPILYRFLARFANRAICRGWRDFELDLFDFTH
jgi:hypothetical protein